MILADEAARIVNGRAVETLRFIPVTESRAGKPAHADRRRQFHNEQTASSGGRGM